MVLAPSDPAAPELDFQEQVYLRSSCFCWSHGLGIQKYWHAQKSNSI